MEAVTLYKSVGVVVYLACLIGLGLVASRRMGDVGDYYAGGKKLGFWAVAFSARATGESAWLLIGLTGMGAAVGAQAFWVVLGEMLGVAGAWILMSHRFKRLTDRYDSITVPDYLESRFRDDGQLLRRVAAGTLVTFVTCYVAAQIYATGTAFESFLSDLGIGFYSGIFIGFAVVMAYSITGGFLAVVWSDVFQGTLMFVALVALPIVGIAAAGGPGPVIDGLRSIDPSLLSLAGADGWTLQAVFSTLGFAMIGLGFLGSPQIFVRFIGMRGIGEIRRGTVVALVWTLLADSGAVLTGMVGRHLLTAPGQPVESVLGTGGEEVLPLIVSELLPPILVGLVIAVVLSAIMSTVDSLLIVASSAVVRDWYQKVRNPELRDDSLVGLSRIATFGIAGIALAVALIATQPGQTVFWFAIFGWSGIAATFCPTIILSLYWDRFTARGALVAMIVGFLCVPLFKFGAPLLPVVGPYFAALAELGPAFALSGLAGVLTSLLDSAGQARLGELRAELDEAAL